ncbi:hypothetical protein I302_102031 [Kwoniella bestiolae CBS 10118]|uniref:Rossman fold oxidoreductase n=1 Tax=Kwoniella bestiolae CBS 10118 TaxID=1296100 RepID=A0A1B9GDX7_9TREE|nr:hypothetical protein I302_00715 [Kwoniella bestiolae CBS 10118]OCF29219.1 hypothetical protein I302_00715 [Kwoniella bestiolae CBS 10118]
MSIAIIQGSSGALGSALTRHILRYTNLSVYALTHRPKSDVDELSAKLLEGDIKGKGKERLSVVGDVDIRREEGLTRAAELVKGREGGGRVRLIACMAGILHPEKSLSSIDPSLALEQFQINTLGHLLTYKHFVPLIPTRKQFDKLSFEWRDEDPAQGLIGRGNSLCWSMSARVGSIGDNHRGGWYSYRASKSATNQLIRTLDHELLNKNSSAIAVGYHPGTVITPFTKPVIGDAKPDPENGRFDIPQAIEKMTGVMGQVRRGDGEKKRWEGRCWDWRGERVEW